MAKAKKTATKKKAVKTGAETETAAKRGAEAATAAKKPKAARKKREPEIRRVESIADELQAMREAIRKRAQDIFASRGGAGGGPIEDWLAAEGELTWKPAIELIEKGGKLTLEVAAAGLEPEEIDLRVTPEHILIQSDRTHQDGEGLTVHACEFVQGKLFREVPLPSRIDPERTKAEYRNGLLRIVAPIVAGSDPAGSRSRRRKPHQPG